MKLIGAVGLAAAVLCSTLLGQPRESATMPLPNEERALSAMRAYATGPWVQGDWGLKCILVTGKGRERVSVPMEIIGGWTPETGRWQRVKLSNGRQWLIKGVAVQTIWEMGDNGKPSPLTAEERLKPISERIPLNWELYTMSFLGSRDYKYKGVEKVRARWCDKVELSMESGPYNKVFVWLDTEFGAPLEAELYGDGMLNKTIRAVSVQRVDVPVPVKQTGPVLTVAPENEGGATVVEPAKTEPIVTTERKEWILKRWEVLDALTHKKVSIEVTALALGKEWDKKFYDEASSTRDYPIIASEEWKVLE